MWLILALNMGRSVRELQESMTSAEFSEWKAFYKLNPFGPERADVGPAIVAQTIVAMTPRKDRTVPPLSDFLYDFAGPEEMAEPKVVKPKQSDEEMKAVIAQVKQVWGRMQKPCPPSNP